MGPIVIKGGARKQEMHGRWQWVRREKETEETGTKMEENEGREG